MAVNKRAVKRLLATQLEASWRDAVAESWPGSTIDAYQVVTVDDDGAFVERLTFQLPSANTSRIRLAPASSHWIERLDIHDRDRAVVYPHPCELTFSARISGAGAVTVERESIDFGMNGLRISATIERREDIVQATSVITMASARFMPETFADLRRAYASLRSLDSLTIALARP